jgi:ABC-type transport system involved in cytochrome c biogenesis ATPase subunit
VKEFALILEYGIDSAPGYGINSGLQRHLDHYSLFIMLNSLTIKNFTVFSEAKLEFSPGLNVVIGENATGKSHLLKLVYAITSIWHEAATEYEELPGQITSGGSKNWWQRRLAEKLVSVFKPDRLGHLSRRDTGRQPTEINATLFTNSNHDETLKFAFTAQSKKEVEILQIPSQGLSTLPIFLPAKDVLELYPGLVKLYEDRELTMDETYPDLCKSLSRVLLKKPPAPTLAVVLDALEKLLGGKVHLEKGRFYVKPPHQKAMEISLIADGLRKIATLTHLIANASLKPQSLLLWDEIETHLNAKLLTPFSHLLMELVDKHQMQIILTTHNFFLMKELSLLVELSNHQIPARFFSLRTDKVGVAVEQGDLLEDLQTIVVLDEWLQLDDREQTLFLHG